MANLPAPPTSPGGALQAPQGVLPPSHTPPFTPAGPAVNQPSQSPPEQNQTPPAKKPKLTHLAERYTHPPGITHDILRGRDELKSGLTPLTLGPFATAEERADYEALVHYQREHLCGFTTRELHDIESFAPLNTDPAKSFLNEVPIHAMWQKDNWIQPIPRQIGRWPLAKGRPGYWDVSNDAIWNAMKPALQLASLFVKNGNTWGWWDAIRRGKYKRVPDQVVPPAFLSPNDIFESCKPRPPFVYNQPDEISKLGNDFLHVANNIKLSIFSGFSCADNGTVEGVGFVYGVTRPARNNSFKKCWIQIAFELVEPLLRPAHQYTDAERLVDSFRLATTILHETTHAFWMIHRESRPYMIRGEPYLNDECIQELGFSIENALFGGVVSEMVTPIFHSQIGNGLPAAGIFQRQWPRVTHSGPPTFPVLLSTPHNWLQQDNCPIPVQFFKNLYQEDFWKSYQKKYGAESTHSRYPEIKDFPSEPVPLVLAYESPPESVTPYIILKSSYLKDADQNSNTRPSMRVFPYEIFPSDQVVADPTPTANEIASVEFENQRRALAARIQHRINQALHIGIDFPLYINSVNPSVQNDVTPFVEPENIGKAACPRYDAISRFLRSRRVRRDLALDTINFIMPEHTMLRYIVDYGQLQPELQPDEWRKFLCIAHHAKEFFSYEVPVSDISQGEIMRIKTGWPTTAPLARPILSDVSAEVSLCFARLTRLTEQLTDLFINGFLDHDIDEFLFFCNRVYRLHRTSLTTPGVPPEGFSRDLFDRALANCASKGVLYTYGPPGVIRKLLPGHVPLTYTPERQDYREDRCQPS